MLTNPCIKTIYSSPDVEVIFLCDHPVIYTYL